jgi:hypothetical protein
LDVFVGDLSGHFVAGCSMRASMVAIRSSSSFPLALFDEVTDKVNDQDDSRNVQTPVADFQSAGNGYGSAL